MKKLRLAAAAAAVMMLAGCSEIPDRSIAGTSGQQTAESAEPSTAEVFAEIPAKNYPVERSDFAVKLNAEGGTFTGNVRTDGDYDGKGYIVLDEGMKLQHIVSAETSQHYKISIAAHSYSGAVVRLKTVNETVGAYYIPAADSADFTMFAVDSVYLSAGPDILSFEVIKGSAALDYITVESSTVPDDSCYYVSNSCVSSNTSVRTLGLKQFLADCYGKRVITGQTVTPGSNAEINAITRETGRTPALRTGDLMFCTPSKYKDTQEYADNEVNTALEWGRNGGIVSFAWHWYAPSGKSDYYADSSTFVLGDAVTERDISMADSEELNNIRESGLITEETVKLVEDIDAAAAVLEKFRSENIPVIFQPIPDGDSSMYWWSGSAENYKWLWKLIFQRMDSYHGLNNLIWVWNGSSEDYFPGEKYCDVIGQSFYENSASSFAGRFSVLAGMTDVPKLLAVTGCDKLPSPDNMLRDNAVWSWFSAGSGNVMITTAGELSEKYTSWQNLHDIYNSEACITLDELPDFEEYAFRESE